ncbi:MAG: chromosome segregation protein SMC [Pseudomonadales bacterium]|nr:chromosome segregation protein SMC [Pseudomonadales bacterium]
MRLKSIKLAGFKSFVDPTTVRFPSNLTAVVGPNGCGKSNIIDAVRWVMGESSAKTLRGESMTDVIFSGSNARMPVGQASIELLFDNSDHSVTGEYAGYNEISVRRTVTRELQSTYYLNGSRCRRRDIQDIFLGTGLGPRSYSIIEQGMISRFVEAKPDELRIFIEEAAGISKYKERRRETENRMRHTRENLARLSDIREELDRQLHHLQRQAKAAEQYSELKQQERSHKAELQAIKWTALKQQSATQEQQIAELEIQLEAVHAEHSSIEKDVEKQRENAVALNDTFQQVQAAFYQVGTEIARHEQSIQHQQERKLQLQAELQRTEQSAQEANQNLQVDLQRKTELSEELAQIAPELERLQQLETVSTGELELAEAAMQEWQHRWDEFNQKASESRQRAEVEQSRIQHLEQNIARLQQRNQKLEQEKKGFAESPEDKQLDEMEHKLAQLDEAAEQHKARVTELVTAIENQRERNNQLSNELSQARRTMQSVQGRHSSLQTLQQAALGQKDAPVVQWLEQQQWHKQPRLAQKIKVDKGWEKALEVVLGHHLQAVCIDSLDNLGERLEKLKQGGITLVDQSVGAAYEGIPGETSLLSKIKSDWNLNALLAGIYVTDSLANALSMRSRLAVHESVVCQEGVWLGPGWIRVTRDSDEKSSLLERQQELKQLAEEMAELEERIENFEVDLNSGLLALKNSEQAREAAQQELSGLLRQHAEVASQLGARKARIEQLNMRKQRLLYELEESQDQLKREQETLLETKERWQEGLQHMEQDALKREKLLSERDANRGNLDQVRQNARHNKDQVHHLALRHQSVTTQLEALEHGMTRLQEQVAGLSERQMSLKESIESAAAPVEELKHRLEVELEKRVALENKLTQARQKVEAVEYSLSQLEQNRLKIDRKTEGVRGQLEQCKLQWQSVKVQCETLEQQLKEAKQDLQQILEQLPDDALETDWHTKLEQIQNRIQRLGAINLAAIDEYKTQSERKLHLDAQNEDLTDALTTLENAIRKIDRETRTKFKETFDLVNKGLQEIFPKVFGGGHASLEMTGEDLLDTGVTIMARPPGKRNSTIHLLSGGEKALVAISMVFAIFKLNPAPFCMLDEVDAPLDDANVGRFCSIVSEMSKTVQFIFITHNKVTMEMASHMMGVTMHEPGVSRLVTVDIEEAVAMAAV